LKFLRYVLYMFSKPAALFFLLFFCTNIFAKIYRWQDNVGNVHFSDTPHVEAVEVFIKQDVISNEYAPIIASPAVSQTNYQKLIITSPANDETFFHDEGRFVVIVEVEPKLRPGDKCILLYDGKESSAFQEVGKFYLQNIERGEHRIQAIVENDAGLILMRSNEVVFYLQQPHLFYKL